MRVKPSHLAGTWYPRDGDELERQVDALLAAATPPEVATPLAALIVPHAGYRYSGQAAATGYVLLRKQAVRRAILLAPSHYHRFRGVAAPDFEAFQTPLGNVEVDVEAVAQVVRAPLIRTDSQPYEEEHSVEIQLPFLQRVCPQAKVVPLLVGELRDDDYAVVAGQVRRLLDGDAIVLVSSDFTHYGARFGYEPFSPVDAATVKRELDSLDGGAIALVARGDLGGFRHYVAETGATICGRMPIGILLQLRSGDGGGVLLSYYTSLDVTGDYFHCVSYAAIAFAAPWSGQNRT